MSKPGLSPSFIFFFWLWIGLCVHSRWFSDEAQIHPVFGGKKKKLQQGLLFQSDKVFYFQLEKWVSVSRKGEKKIIGKREEQKQSTLYLRDGLGAFSIMQILSASTYCSHQWLRSHQGDSSKWQNMHPKVGWTHISFRTGLQRSKLGRVRRGASTVSGSFLP